jgi:hypothetical protein
MVNASMLKGLVASLVTFFTSFAGQALWPFLEDGVRDGSEKMTSSMFEGVLGKMKKNPAAIKWISWGIRGLGGAIDIPLPLELFSSEAEHAKAQYQFNDLLEEVSRGAADAMVGSDIGDLPDAFAGTVSVPTVAQVTGLGFLGRFVHTAHRFTEDIDDGKGGLKTVHKAAVTCPAVHAQLDETQLTRDLLGYLSSRSTNKSKKNQQAPTALPRFGHSVNYINYDVGVDQLGLAPCPHCMGLLPEADKKVKTAEEQLSADAHQKIDAILEDLAWQPDGGREPTFYIERGLKLPAPKRAIKALENSLAKMNLVDKGGEKDGKQRWSVGVDNDARISMVVRGFRKLLEPEGSLNTAKGIDALDEMNVWGKVVKHARTASDGLGKWVVSFANGDAQKLMFRLLLATGIGVSLWVTGLVLHFATDLPELLTMIIHASGCVVIATIALILGFLIQGGVDLIVFAADFSTKWLQVGYEWLERLAGDQAVEKMHGKVVRNTGIGVAVIVSVLTGLTLVVMFCNWLFGYDSVALVAVVSAMMFFFFALPSTLGAAGWVDRDPEAFYGAMFNFKQNRGTARFFGVLARVFLVIAVFTLPFTFLASLAGLAPHSNFGYTPRYGVVDERAFLVTDYQDRIWVSNSPVANAHAAGTLVKCKDARGVSTVCLPKGGKVPSLDQQGRKWYERWDGSLVVNTPENLEVEETSGASSAKVKEHGTKSVFGAVFKGLHVHWSVFILGLIALFVLCLFSGGSVISLLWGLLSNEENAWVKSLAGGAGSAAGLVALVLLICVMVFYPILANIYVAADWAYDSVATAIEGEEDDGAAEETATPTNNGTEDSDPVASNSPTQTGSSPERKARASRFQRELDKLQAMVE